MAVERTPANSILVDASDRVLDEGVVTDAYVRVALVGIDLIGIRTEKLDPRAKLAGRKR